MRMSGTQRQWMTWALSLLAIAWTRIGLGADWPQWLGPNRNGISSETPAAPLAPVPQPIWKNAVGVGVSSVVVSRGRAFAMGQVRGPQDRGTDTVYCFDADTGAVLWTHAYECLSCRSQDVRFYGPRSTPTVDGDRVFTLSLAGHLFCFAADSGKVLWSRDLVRDLHGRVPVHGYCCSPLVYRDSLILELNAPDASYVALDKTSGNVVWWLAGGNVTCGSPVLTRIEDVDCVVFMGGGAVVGVNARNGRATVAPLHLGPRLDGSRGQRQ